MMISLQIDNRHRPRPRYPIYNTNKYLINDAQFLIYDKNDQMVVINLILGISVRCVGIERIIPTLI